MTVHEARAALRRAQESVAKAEHARDQARDQLDAALAAHGWTRLVGAFTADAERLYVSKLYPTATLGLADVLDVLERQAAA